MHDTPARRWDIYCRVIDNHGDIGVCWRLACDLAARGQAVRLWVDDATALAWMAPGGAPDVRVSPWPEGAHDGEPGDVVIEAFGCELPVFLVDRMTAMDQPPVWINLEYLSAETFVERSHRMLSPQRGGLRKWFFHPGFTAHTGGLIREADLLQRRQNFDAAAWLHTNSITRRAEEQVVSLFCYEQPALPALLEHLAQHPTLLLATTGHAARQVEQLLGPSLQRGALRAVMLPAFSQTDYDHLLWASDLNFVRGEDSFVRAQWAAKPFVWQIYPQDDGADAVKLQAFLGRFMHTADTALSSSIRQTWAAWNGGGMPWPTEPEAAAWQRHCLAWRDTLALHSDLASQLIGFAAQTR